MVTGVYKIVTDMWCTRRNILGPLDEFGTTKMKILITKQNDTIIIKIIIIIIIIITGPHYMPIRHYSQCAYEIFRAYEGMERKKRKIKK
jgi:hypothetical protein